MSSFHLLHRDRLHQSGVRFHEWMARRGQLDRDGRFNASAAAAVGRGLGGVLEFRGAADVRHRGRGDGRQRTGTPRNGEPAGAARRAAGGDHLELRDDPAGNPVQLFARSDWRIRRSGDCGGGIQAIIVHGWIKPIIFIFIGPMIGMVAGIMVTVVTSWIVRRQAPQKVDRWFRRLQLVSAAAFSFSHGTNDAQKSMGIITAALVTGGVMPTYKVPDWVIICCALAMAGGTMAGGWRVVKTMGQRITKLNPFGGFAAETSAAITLIGTAAAGIPVSSTHVITGAIMGVGVVAEDDRGALGRDAAHLWAWILTIPCAGLMGAMFYFVCSTLDTVT